MIGGLSSIGTGSLETVRMVSSSIDAVTQTYVDLSIESQQETMALTKKLTKGLLELTEDSTQEEIIEVASSILSTINNNLHVRALIITWLKIVQYMNFLMQAKYFEIL